MQRIFPGALLLAAAVTIGCAPIRVSSFVEQGVEFTQFRTYEWVPAEPSATGDPRLDDNPFFHDRVRRAVEEGLTTKGLRKSISTRPDLWMRYRANMSQSFEVMGADRGDGTCRSGHDCEARVVEYEAGTLVLDAVDARTNQLVWRGSARQNVDALIDNQDWMEEYVDKSVARLMVAFPSHVPRGDTAARER